MSSSLLLAPDLLLAEGLQSGQVLRVGADGRIAEVRARRADDDVVALPGKALLPGFVNGHSHAFQRALRGRAQAQVAGGDFWSWRGQMFQLVERIDAEALEAICALAYVEMLEAGWTSVAEFHYLHRPGDTEDAGAGARAVVAAAEATGIRQTLVRVAYLRAGYRQTPSAGQRHFLESADDYERECRRLARGLGEDPRLQMGVGAHSVRAVGREDLERVRDLADRLDCPCHIHVSEQQREVDECLGEVGQRPLELLGSLGMLGRRTTLVHGNYFDAEEQARFVDSEASLCVCPTTEADLADGWGQPVPVAGDLWGRGKRELCLGTDSHIIIDPLAETRLLEHLERMTRGRRCELVPETLLHMATLAGAPAVGADVGRLVPGAWADLVAIDLAATSLAGCEADTLLAALVLSASADVVSEVWVAGEQVVSEGKHRHRESVHRAYANALRGVWPGNR